MVLCIYAGLLRTSQRTGRSYSDCHGEVLRGTKQSKAIQRIRMNYFPLRVRMTEHVTVIVMARYEAIQCTRMDCFTLRVRNDGSVLQRSSWRGMKPSSVPVWIAPPCGFAKTEYVTVIVMARYEAIQCTRMDCFPLRVRNDVAVFVMARNEAIQCTRMDCFPLRVRKDGACYGYRHGEV
jgi:hypothetical protein